MNEAMPSDMLLQAISAYDYPPVTCDFVQQRERRFPSMQDLENYLGSLLHTSDAQSVKNGLSTIQA